MRGDVVGELDRLAVEFPELYATVEVANRAYAGCGTPRNPCSEARAAVDHAFSRLFEADRIEGWNRRARSGISFKIKDQDVGPFVFSSGEKLLDFMSIASRFHSQTNSKEA